MAESTWTSSISDNATLAFFTNPSYFNILKRKNLPLEKDITNDIKFYKKRIASLFKDILKGEEVHCTTELKEIHNLFITTAIKYFQRVDTQDIIQGQYDNEAPKAHVEANGEANVDPNGDEEKSPEDLLNEIEGDIGTLDEANDIMMRKTINVASLDNYVIFPPVDTSANLRIIPMKMEIDLKSPELKIKGVKPKKKKKGEMAL